MEAHYALLLSQLLGRVAKKLPKLDSLPLIEQAPINTRLYVAEATRCYLLGLDRACIAMCRACLEDTLKKVLTPAMQSDWRKKVAENKLKTGAPNQMHALIEVCVTHGVLQECGTDAHDVRKAGNRVLHIRSERSDIDLAGEVLNKTRRIIRLIHGDQAAAQGSH